MSLFHSYVLYHPFHDDVIQWKHFRVTGPLCGISPVPVISPHKGQWRGALMFSLICVWMNGWVNNHEAGDLRRIRGHYDVIVMIWKSATADQHWILGILVRAVITNMHYCLPHRSAIQLNINYSYVDHNVFIAWVYSGIRLTWYHISHSQLIAKWHFPPWSSETWHI